MLKLGQYESILNPGFQKGKKNIRENMEEARPMVSGPDIIQMEKKNMKVFMSRDSRLESGPTMMKKAEKIWKKPTMFAPKNVRTSIRRIVVA